MSVGRYDEKMKIVLIGGFFGSGKTTITANLTRQMLARSERVCIVENEIGQIGVDDLLLERGGVEVTTITGGCVCCQVTGSLVDALRDMEQRFDPEWVLAELTGIAYLDGLRHTMESCLPKTCSIICVAVADASRWASLSRALPKVIERQTEGADLLVINKADLNGDTEKIEAEVRQMGVSCPVFPMSAVTDSGARLLAEVEKAF